MQGQTATRHIKSIDLQDAQATLRAACLALQSAANSMRSICEAAAPPPPDTRPLWNPAATYPFNRWFSSLLSACFTGMHCTTNCSIAAPAPSAPKAAPFSCKGLKGRLLCLVLLLLSSSSSSRGRRRLALLLQLHSTAAGAAAQQPQALAGRLPVTASGEQTEFKGCGMRITNCCCSHFEPVRDVHSAAALALPIPQQ
jgi:hypothetical protein